MPMLHCIECGKEVEARNQDGRCIDCVLKSCANCPKCKEPVPQNWNFCGYCGHKLS